MANMRLKRNQHSNHINKSRISITNRSWVMVGMMSRAAEVPLKMIKTKIILTYHLKEEILSNNIKISSLSNLSVRGSAQALAS
jgi:hypothetical protein